MALLGLFPSKTLNGNSFSIFSWSPENFNSKCTSSFVIYLATCRKCGGQYVGKSQTQFKTRHSNHKSEIKRQIGGLGHHYGGEKGFGYQNISIQIIDQVEIGNKEALVQAELYWQDQLRVFIENGRNAQCRRKDKRFFCIHPMAIMKLYYSTSFHLSSETCNLKLVLFTIW